VSTPASIRNWLATAPPHARLGYLIGERRGAGYHVDQDTIAQLAYLAGVTEHPELIRITVTVRFDPEASCARAGCDEPVGAYAGTGKHPTHCPTHRRHDADPTNPLHHRADRLRYGNHVRWHTNPRDGCTWCTEEATA